MNTVEQRLSSDFNGYYPFERTYWERIYWKSIYWRNMTRWLLAFETWATLTNSNFTRTQLLPIHPQNGGTETTAPETKRLDSDTLVMFLRPSSAYSIFDLTNLDRALASHWSQSSVVQHHAATTFAPPNWLVHSVNSVELLAKQASN